MRIPRSHAITHALIDRYGLATKPFTMDNPEAYCFFGGRRVRHREIAGDPRALGFEVAPNEYVPPSQLWSTALEPLATQLRDHGDDAWGEIATQYDQYSVREFLEVCKWSEGAIEMFGLLFNQEALMNSSFLELLREELGSFYTDLVYLDGGTDTLPRAFLPDCRHASASARRCVAIDQSDDRCHALLPERREPVARESRLRHDHRAVPGAAPRGGAHAVLASQAARHPPAPLRRVGEDVPPVPAAVLGGRRRHRRRRHRHRPRDAQRVLPRPRPRHRPRRRARELHVG